MHVIKLNLKESLWISQRSHIQMAGHGGGPAVQFAGGHRRSQKFQTWVSQMPWVVCFLSESNDTSSKGWTGIQTTLNYTRKTKKCGVLFIETSHILSNMQITPMIKNWDQILTDREERWALSNSCSCFLFFCFVFSFLHLMDPRVRH